MIQIRNVPDELHRKAKIRAATEGLTLSDFALRELERALSRPTVDELIERIQTLPRPELSESAAEAVRAERDSR